MNVTGETYISFFTLIILLDKINVWLLKSCNLKEKYSICPQIQLSNG